MPKFIVEYSASSTSYDTFLIEIEAANKEAAEARLLKCFGGEEDFTDGEEASRDFRKFIMSDGHEFLEITDIEEQP